MQSYTAIPELNMNASPNATWRDVRISIATESENSSVCTVYDRVFIGEQAVGKAVECMRALHTVYGWDLEKGRWTLRTDAFSAEIRLEVSQPVKDWPALTPGHQQCRPERGGFPKAIIRTVTPCGETSYTMTVDTSKVR